MALRFATYPVFSHQLFGGPAWHGSGSKDVRESHNSGPGNEILSVHQWLLGADRDRCPRFLQPAARVPFCPELHVPQFQGRALLRRGRLPRGDHGRRGERRRGIDRFRRRFLGGSFQRLHALHARGVELKIFKVAIARASRYFRMHALGAMTSLVALTRLPMLAVLALLMARAKQEAKLLRNLSGAEAA